MPFNYKVLVLLIGGVLLLFISGTGNPSVHAQTTATLTPTATKSLAAQLGFTALVLDDLQQQGMSEVVENVAFSAYGHDYRLVHIRPTINDQIRIKLNSVGQLLMFQVDVASAELIWQGEANSASTSYLSGDKTTGEDWPAPGNWEKNGKIDFGIYYYAENSCASNFSYLDVYVLNPDGTITRRFSKFIPAGYAVESVELGKNNSLILTALDIRGLDSGMNVSSCSGPINFRYLELTGTTLTDVSAQHSDDYTRRLGDVVYFITTWPVNIDPNADSRLYAGQLMELLMIYDALNQRDAGYMLMTSLATQAFATERIEHNTYLDKFFLPAMAQLYAQNQPFVPPEFIGPNAQHNTLSFYD